MLDLAADKRCQALEAKLAFYANQVKERQIDRRQYIKTYGTAFEVNSKFPYPYNDRTEAHLINQIDAYLLSFSEKDQQQVNGHLLWQYKKYFCEPFAKHAKLLATRAIMAYPLSDNDKINFLDYLFRSNKQYDLDKRVIFKLAEYDVKQNPELTNRLFTKAVSYFENNPRKDDKYVDLVYGMFNIFSERANGISSKSVANYADIYFKMAERTSVVLPPWPLGKLATRTETAVKLAASGQKKAIDKDAIRQIFQAYSAHVMATKEFNQVLGAQMYDLGRVALKNYDYNRDEVAALVSAIRPSETDEKGRKLRPSKKTTGMRIIADRLDAFYEQLLKDREVCQPQFNNPLHGVDIDALGFSPSRHQVLGYANYLFEYAAFNPQKEVQTADLMKLMQKHAAGRRLDRIEATLFSEGKKQKNLDKSLVLDVATAYANSVDIVHPEYGSLNEHLGQQMTEMFKDITANYGYSKTEVKKVAEQLSQGASGDKYFKNMGEAVIRSYIVSRQRSARLAKTL